LRKDLLVLDSEGNMPSEGIPLEKSAALLVNCVKPFVLLKQSQLRQSPVQMEADEPLDMTLI
jgi:hypothetical protein